MKFQVKPTTWLEAIPYLTLLHLHSTPWRLLLIFYFTIRNLRTSGKERMLRNRTEMSPCIYMSDSQNYDIMRGQVILETREPFHSPLFFLQGPKKKWLFRPINLKAALITEKDLVKTKNYVLSKKLSSISG